MKLLSAGFLSSAVLLALAGTACTPVTAVRGNIVEDEALSRLHTGLATRDDVTTVLGTPSAVSPFDDATWYYIGERTEQTAFLSPDVVERRIVAIRFDDGGMIEAIEEIDETAARDVQPVSRTTPTGGKELGVLEQLLGNVGAPLPSGGGQGGPGGR